MEKKKYETDREEYRTGDTQPPKSHGGVIAVVLVLAIFFGGLSSILEQLNVRLVNQFEENIATPVSFSEQEAAFTLAREPGTGVRLGFCSEEVHHFWQLYRDLPQGLYIRTVEEGSSAEKLGIVPGDILIRFDGQRLTDEQTLNAILEEKFPGDRVSMILWRDGKQFPVTLELEAD